MACFAARDWDAITETLADDISTNDRRRVVNAGLRQGRAAVTTEISGFADIGVQRSTSDIIATRGERLVLSRERSLGRDQRPEAFHTELLHIVEIDTGEKVASVVVFDVDDLKAAFEELDARYLATEAGAHSHMWSAVAGSHAALNRREPPLTPPTASMSTIGGRKHSGPAT